MRAELTKFQLSYPDGITNPSTPPITYTGLPGDAATIQAVINATLFNVIGYAGNPAVVTQTASGSGSATFAINFTGSMAGIQVFQLNAALTAGSGSVGTTLFANGGNPNLTTINNNTRLEVNTPGGIINNSMVVTGAGTDNLLGAIVMSVTGTTTIAGNITMTGNTTISTIINGSYLNITGGISDSGTADLIVQDGSIFLDPRVPISAANNFHGGNTYHGNTQVVGGILLIGHPYALGAGGARATAQTFSAFGIGGVLGSIPIIQPFRRST